MRGFGRAYDNWLEAPYQEQADKDAAIDEIADNLMQGECDPQDVDVFLSAVIDNDCLYPIKEKLQKILSQGQGYLALGEAIWDAVHDHQRDIARQMAVEQYKNPPTDFIEPY